MYNFTVPMALMDFVPVAFFAVTALLLLPFIPLYSVKKHKWLVA